MLEVPSTPVSDPESFECPTKRCHFCSCQTRPGAAGGTSIPFYCLCFQPAAESKPEELQAGSAPGPWAA